MKATIENTNEHTLPAKYRNLKEGGRNKGMIVLFHEVDKGMVIEATPDALYRVGYYSDVWVDCTDPEHWERVGETPKTTQHTFPALYRTKKGSTIVLAITQNKGLDFTTGAPYFHVGWVPFTDTTTWELLPVGINVILGNE